MTTKDFLPESLGPNHEGVLYTGAHYTRQNMGKLSMDLEDKLPSKLKERLTLPGEYFFLLF